MFESTAELNYLGRPESVLGSEHVKFDELTRGLTGSFSCNTFSVDINTLIIANYPLARSDVFYTDELSLFMCPLTLSCTNRVVLRCRVSFLHHMLGYVTQITQFVLTYFRSKS